MNRKPPINEAHGRSSNLNRLAISSSPAGSGEVNPSSSSSITLVEEPLEAPVSDPISNPSTLAAPVLTGAWSKPLLVSSIAASESGLRELNANWPSLSDSRRGKATGQQAFGKPTHKSSETLTRVAHSRDDRKEDAIRFPWAARMNPNSRNLYRATEPEYLEDGTPKVTIPPHVLLRGLENQKEYILGQFYRCSTPSGGLIFAVFNKLWGRKCRITIRKLSDSNYLFHIPDEETRKWVLQRALWHVDDCLMFVAPWSPEATLAIPEIKTIPVWVTLKKIPNILYSIPGISHIASGLGAPMATHKPRLDPILMGEAKILVEVELSKAFPPKIAASDENGFISMVDVEYAWLPTKCSRCGQLGHKVKRCLQSETAQVDGNATPPVSAPATSTAQVDGNAIATSAPAPATSAREVSASEVDGNAIAISISIDATSAPATATSTEVSETMVEIIPPSVVETVTSSVTESDVARDDQTPNAKTTVSPNDAVIFSTTSPIGSLANDTTQGNVFGGNDFATSNREFFAGYESGDAVNVTRGGRQIKPSQKVLEMEWSMVSRRKGGRGGKKGRASPH